MKKFLKIVMPLAFATPLVATISCGDNKNERLEQSNSVKQNQGSSQPQMTNTGSHVATQHSLLSATIAISEPKTKQGYSQAEIASEIYQKLPASNQGNPWGGEWQVYEVTPAESTHKFNFVFDADSHIPKDLAKDLINRFTKYTNYGYGLLTLENIFLTNKKMGAAGWGGAGKDLLIQCDDLNANQTKEEKDDELQKVLNTIKHEYGHHETSVLIDSTGLTQATNLVKNNVIGSDMFTNTKSDSTKTTATNPSALAEQNRLDALFQSKGNGSKLDNVLENFFGPQRWFGNDHIGYHVVNGYEYKKDFWFDTNYHLSNMEFLNRAMNIFELMPWDKGDMKTLYSFPDILKYEIDQRKMIDLTTKVYTDDAKKMIELYGKYVYGYDGFGLEIKSRKIKGFSNVDFDFIQFSDVMGNQFTTKIDKIKSHYLTKDKLFDEPRVINSSTAYDGTINSSLPAYKVNANSIKFYQDTNHDGVLDTKVDKEVIVQHRLG